MGMAVFQENFIKTHSQEDLACGPSLANWCSKGVLDGMEMSRLPNMIIIHCKSQCVIMLQDLSPPEIKVEEQKGPANTLFSCWW